MKALYQDILTKLGQFVDGNSVARFKHIDIENDQVERMRNGEGYSFADPAVLVRIESPKDIKQLGNGVQLYDNLIVTLFVIHRKENTEGSLDRNLDVMDLKDDLWLFMQTFQPSGAHPFSRAYETEDNVHDNLYIYQQQYRTNYTTTARQEPYGGVIKPPPTDLEQQVTIQGSTNPQPHIYPE